MIFRKLHSEDKAGIYLTVILHLCVIIILLVIQIGKELSAESSFVMDFTKQEELEKQQAEEEFKEDISDKLDEMIRNHQLNIKNVAVDAGDKALKDDKGNDGRELYEEAERLRQEILEAQNQTFDELAVEEVKEEKEQILEESNYKGPSVLSYKLEGRKASYLKIPVYKCYGGGFVTVIITVNPQGKVIAARVMESESAEDECLRRSAIEAAMLSRFSRSATAPPKQIGEICYCFIAQ